MKQHGFDFDLFVIGAGSGGVRASRVAARCGARVAVAESSRIGGTCVNLGCVPKKLFVYASHFRDDFEDALGFGWSVDPPRFDWTQLLAQKDREIARLNKIYKGLLDGAGVTLFESRARLIDRNTIELADRRVTAERILIATGAVPHLPTLPGIEHAISSDQAFHLPSLPRRIVIVGGGYIAVEFAGIFAGLGVQVTQLYRGSLFLRGFDHDLRVELAESMRRRDIDLRFDSDVERIDRRDDGTFTVTLRSGDRLETDLVMYASGRTPNTKGLGLSEAGVTLDDAGAVVVDDYSQTSVPNIWAVGDVTNRLNLTPVAIAEGQAFVETVFNENPQKPDYDNVPTAVFSQPSLATVGLTEEAARSQHLSIDVYKAHFRPMKNTLSGRNERTLMKLVVEKSSGRVLGAHMLGPDAAEIIQGIAIAVRAGVRKVDFDRTIGIHPSAAEEFVTMRTPKSL
ncbi:MAG: glutathione-disulfide reductase [Myxococcales bacterium]|nr:glutathione-disulfide reductase [Myxococcales bacterium]